MTTLLENILTRVKSINAEISGIVTSCDHTDIPNSLNTGQLPLVLPLLDEGTLTYSAGQLSADHYNIWLCVYLSPLGQGNVAQSFSAAIPYISKFKVRYAAALNLDELSGVTQALLTDFRVGLLPPFDQDYIGVAIKLEVWGHEVVTTGA